MKDSDITAVVEALRKALSSTKLPIVSELA